MPVLQDLLALGGNIPILLDLNDHGRAYQKELERRLGVASETVRRSVSDLLDKGYVKEIPYDGKIPNVGAWIVLTDIGERIAEQLVDCQKKLRSVAAQSNKDQRRGRV